MSQHDSHAVSHANDHGDVKSYVIGFVLSVILTVIPFWMVMEGDFSKSTTIWSIVTLGLVQIWVHLNAVNGEGKQNNRISVERKRIPT